MVRAASRDSPFRNTAPGDASTPKVRAPKTTAPSNRRLRATLRPNRRLRRRLAGRWHWTARAEKPRAKDLPARRLLPQDDVVRGSPPHPAGFAPLGSLKLLEHPFSVVGPSSEGLDAPFVLFDPTEAPVPTSPREGQRFPASRDAFRRQEFDTVEIAPCGMRTDTLMTPPPRFHGVGIATEDCQRLCSPLRRA